MEVSKVVSVKILKPYYIKADNEFVRIILAYQYFSIVIKQKVYDFIPTEANEIKINRKTKKIENMDVRFAFQHNKDVVNVTMEKLVTLPGFIDQLYSIAQSYYYENEKDELEKIEKVSAAIIGELETMNIRRLIDQALDERDEASFYKLSKLL